MNSIEKELLPVMRALSVMLTSGVGLETALKRISLGDYGDISKRFGIILANSLRNGTLERSLEQEHARTKIDVYRKLLRLLVSGTRGEIDMVASLDRLAEREMQVREVETEKFIDRIGTFTEVFMVLGILIPIIIIVTVATDSLMINGGIGITPGIVAIITWTVLLFLSYIAISTSRREPVL